MTTTPPIPTANYLHTIYTEVSREDLASFPLGKIIDGIIYGYATFANLVGDARKNYSNTVILKLSSNTLHEDFYDPFYQKGLYQPKVIDHLLKPEIDKHDLTKLMFNIVYNALEAYPAFCKLVFSIPKDSLDFDIGSYISKTKHMLDSSHLSAGLVTNIAFIINLYLIQVKYPESYCALNELILHAGRVSPNYAKNLPSVIASFNCPPEHTLIA